VFFKVKVTFKVRITSLSLNGEKDIKIASLSLYGGGIGRGCKFNNLNISPFPKIPSHKERGMIREVLRNHLTKGREYICR